MNQHAILHGENRAGRACVFQEQRIVSDAQTQQHVHFRLFLIQHLGLEYRIAHRFKFPDPYFLMLQDSDRFFRHPTRFAYDGNHIETVGRKETADDFCLFG